MTVQGVSFGLLVGFPEIHAAFKARVKEGLARVVGVATDDIDLHLALGSVRIVAFITPPNGTTTAELIDSMQDERAELSAAVVASVRTVPGIESVCLDGSTECVEKITIDNSIFMGLSAQPPTRVARGGKSGYDHRTCWGPPDWCPAPPAPPRPPPSPRPLAQTASGVQASFIRAILAILASSIAIF